MDVIKQLEKLDTLLVLCNESELELYKQETKRFDKATVVTQDGLSKVHNDTADVIISTRSNLTKEILEKLLSILKPGGRLTFSQDSNMENLEFELATIGFMNIQTAKGNVTAMRPIPEVGSSVSVIPPRKSNKFWKSNEDLDDNMEIIKPNEVSEANLKNTDLLSLHIFGKAEEHKICKNGTCIVSKALAEKPRMEKIINVNDTPKSSHYGGSFYLDNTAKYDPYPYLGTTNFYI